jgi:hypothetical protein
MVKSELCKFTYYPGFIPKENSKHLNGDYGGISGDVERSCSTVGVRRSLARVFLGELNVSLLLCREARHLPFS